MTAENHYLLGVGYQSNNQFELAIQHYHAALSYNQNHGLAWNNLGTTLEKIDNKKLAKIAYTTAIAINPNHCEAQNNLAAIYCEEGQLEKARTHFEAAITANPSFIDAHYNLSVIKTYSSNDPHLAYLESIKSKIDKESEYTKIRYYFALGKALDDTEQYSSAFKAYAEGNKLHNAHQPWDKQKLQSIVQQLIEIFSPTYIRKPRKIDDTRCPIFIVGMPRAGTTLIEQILSTHPSIYGAGELNILDTVINQAHLKSNLPFDRWLKQLTEDDFAKLGLEYLDRTWTLAPTKKYIIDKMPGNAFYLGFIYRMFAKVKIIHALRDPMDSCFSCYTRLFKDNMSFAYNLNDLADYYALYTKIMNHWYAILPSKTIFDVAYEQMIENHESLSKQLINYLELPWDSSCLNFYKNDRLVKTASITQVRKPIYKTSIQRWRYFSKELEPLYQMLAPYRQGYRND